MNNRTILFLLAAALIASGLGTGVYKMTRGIRNNNPGNIRRTNDKWVGLADEQTDPEYFVFSDSVYGIRAMAKLLRNYQSRYGLNTVRDIISRWAPPSENPTQKYVEFVASKVSGAADKPINTMDETTLSKLIHAIIQFENGSVPYSITEIKRGISLA